ncbi:MAG: flagellar hook-basal body complex protein FliE [Verrucomicrobiota bacterium]
MIISPLQIASTFSGSPAQATSGISTGANPGNFNFQLPKDVEFQPTNATTAPLSSLGVNEPTTFGHLMQQTVRDVNQSQQVAGEKVRDVLQGGPTPVHEAMIAVEESNVSFTMLTEMRNKLLESYQEVMRIPV